MWQYCIVGIWWTGQIQDDEELGESVEPGEPGDPGEQGELDVDDNDEVWKLGEPGDEVDPHWKFPNPNLKELNL